MTGHFTLEARPHVHRSGAAARIRSVARTVVPGVARTTVTDVEPAIGGMTCASCANRVERKLNKLDGGDRHVGDPLPAWSWAQPRG